MRTKKILFSLLAFILVISMMPVSALAVTYDTSVSADYFTVISKDEYTLAPGVTETELIVNNVDGNDRKIVHVMEVDATEETVQVLPGYYGIDKLNPDDLAGDRAIWTDKQLTQTVAYYENTLGLNVVGAMNTALAYDSNAPYGYMVWNGVVLGTPEIHPGADTYLAIYKDGSAELRDMSTPLDGNEWTAISANFGWLVKDGALTSTTVERTSSDASRSMIGIKEDGTLVFCQVDGRNGAISSGLSNYEMGEMMLALGCVNAVNCDGGGSSTFITKREGTTENVMRSIPSDGSERATINSVIIVSTAQPTGIFDHATIDSEYDYFAAGAIGSVTTAGVDTNGYPVAVPEDISWQLKDESFGTVVDGVFTSNGKKGDAVIQMVHNGNVVGEKTIHVIDPEVFAFNVKETVLPYGKTMDIVFASTYGADDWAVCVDGAYTLSLSDDSAAAISGAKLIGTTDESVTGVVLTATYKADTSVTATMNITYGKGSEIIFDFEDGDISEWMGFDEAKQWNIDNDVNNTLTSSKPIGGQFSENVDSDTFLATEENGGQVKSGKYALGLNLDNRSADFAGWTYNILYHMGAPKVLRDVANGQSATTIGMWVYIPEGAAGLAMQLTVYKGDSAESLSGTQLHFYFTTANGVKKNLNSCTEADIPESRWVYATADLTAYKYVSLVDPTANLYREPSFIRTYIKPMLPAVHTFYFDDFTLDYSSAVDDRVLPTISNVTYATADTALALENGAAITGSAISFAANIADNIALDYATGKICVDGVVIESASASGKVLSCGDIKLAPGAHTVTFEIKDTLGNLAKVTRSFTIAGDAVIYLGGHNDLNTVPEYDSIYYVDINTADIANVDSITTLLKLQNANAWETEGAVVASGFNAEFDYNENSGLLTVKIEKNGKTVNVDDTTLVSIPVRVWSWDAINHITGAVITPEAQFKTGYCPIVSIDCEVVYGAVEFTKSDYLGVFGGDISVDTMLNDNVNPWHYHTVEALENVEATCTTEGYTDRTYCHVCGSVVEWGETVAAGGHDYAVDGDHVVCECGDVLGTTGLMTLGGNTYYLIAGKLVSDWQLIGDDWYYFSPKNYSAVTGTFGWCGIIFKFGEDGVLTTGSWDFGTYGTRYYYGPNCYRAQKGSNVAWAEIDGKTYGFGYDGFRYEGVAILKEGYIKPQVIHYFDEEGVYLGKSDETGVVSVKGTDYYVIDGVVTGVGLIEIDGDFYYIHSNGTLATGACYITADALNGYFAENAGVYYFGEDGKMLDGVIKDGVYFENGQPCKKGVIKYTDGYYYYIRTYGKITTGAYSIPEADLNGLFNGIGVYYFDDQGRMLDKVVRDDGVYFENGQPVYKGVFQHTDGYYYYIRSYGKVTAGAYYITAKDLNGLFNGAGVYYFDDEGRMLDKVVRDDGVYFENGQPAYKGVFQHTDGNYYYARTYGKLVKGAYYISDNALNGLFNGAGVYYFDDEYKMLDGVIKDGVYFEDGQPCHKGVFQHTDGYYYYVRTYGKITTGAYYITEKDINGLFNGAGVYYFDNQGRMLDKVVRDDGVYFENGQPYYKGVFEHTDGNYYYARSYGKLTKGAYYILDKDLNGLLNGAGVYYFDDEYKMLDGIIKDGVYFENGQPYKKGVFQYEDGYYYYIRTYGKITTGAYYIPEKDLNGLFKKAGVYYFDDQGRMLDGIIKDGVYFENGQPYYKGVFEMDGDIYYAGPAGKIKTGVVDVPAVDAHGVLSAGTYTFDADGKLIND